jgi:hypothetical protein
MTQYKELQEEEINMSQQVERIEITKDIEKKTV